jgi:dihydroorotase
LAPFGELKKAGVVGVTDDGKCVQNAEVMRRALEYSKMFELPVISHCEDENLSQNGVINEGYISTISGLEGIPRLAEEVIIMRDIALAQATGAQLHIAHITTAYSVELVRRAKEQGIKVTAEVTPHHFSLTDESVLELEFNTNTKVNPPLREAKDIEAIKEGLKDGTIDVIATDHAPHTTTEKEVEFALAPFGIIGLETALPLVISELVEKGVLSLSEAIAKLTCEPAKIVNLSKGKIAEGEDADITIISLKKEFVFNRENILSRSSNSPFIGRKFNCSVLTTIVGGKIVMRNEKLTKRRK